MSGSKASVIEKINRMPVSILGKRGRCMRTDEKKKVHSRETITRKRYLVSHE